MTTMKLLSRCPVCDSTSIYKLPTQKGVYRLPELETVYFGCNSCSVEFQNPRPESMDSFYTGGRYRNMLQQSPSRVSDEQQRRAKRIIAFITDRLEDVRSFLDFGSATGDLMQVVRQQYGADILGVEIDGRLADYANSRGRHTVEEITGRDYDLVAIVHTLEHVVAPTEILKNVGSAMLRGGHIYIEVPKRAYVEAHVISFTEPSLRRCAELAGIEAVEVTEHDGDIILWGRLP